ncbi:MAG: manganese efflux pump [Ileibacterium sp.]|nr:manganese efflux pump [Ileibacterium sp.]
MDLLTIVVLGVGLSMDAFAVSICKGLAMRKVTWKEMGCAGLWFGIFQGMMPLIGYLLGSLFAGYIEMFSSWIAFILLAFIGGNMVKEALSGEEEDADDDMSAGKMFLLAVATSIDALAVGITFSMIPVEMFAGMNRFMNTLLACLIITFETGVLSAAGVKIGGIFGAKYKNKAQIAGGVVLILLGIRILLQHYGIM